MRWTWMRNQRKTHNAQFAVGDDVTEIALVRLALGLWNQPLILGP
jgi:hypothetical protein